MDTATAGDLHPLVAKVVSEVRSLVDGNGAAATDVVVRLGTCHRRQVGMALDSGVGWATNTSSVSGRQDPSGSARMAGWNAGRGGRAPPPRGAGGWAGRRRGPAPPPPYCNVVINDPAAWEGLAQYLGRDAYRLFGTLEPGFRWCEIPRRWHFHEACGSCGGSGRHHCYQCSSGQVTCTSCGGSARRSCVSCFGSGKVNGYVTDSTGKLSMQPVNCQSCGGAGKGSYGSCGSCQGGKVQCPSCGGRGFTSCAGCGATGWKTHAIAAHLTGSVSRTMTHAADSPKSFRAAVDELGMLAVAEASERKVEVRRTRGGASVVLACTLPHARAELSCRGVAFDIDAVGEAPLIPIIPKFLDALLKPATDAILAPAMGAEAVIRSARNARLTDDLLQELGARRLGKTADFAARWKDAVSVDLVQRLRDRLLRTYDTVGRRAVRAAWLGALLPLVAYSLLVELYAPAVIPPLMVKRTDTFQPVDSGIWDAAFLLAPIAIVWLIAGNSARTDARRLVGGKAKRRPGQGWWPAVVAACMIVPHVSLIAVDISGDTLGLPYEREFAALPVLRSWEEFRRRSAQQQPSLVPAIRSGDHRRHAAIRR